MRRKDELESMREDGLSAERQREFRASAQATARWERAHPLEGFDPVRDPLPRVVVEEHQHAQD